MYWAYIHAISKANTWINKIGQHDDNPMTAVHHILFNEYACGMKIKDLGDLFPKNSVKAANCYDMDCCELRFKNNISSLRMPLKIKEKGRSQVQSELVQVQYCTDDDRNVKSTNVY